MFPGPMVSTYRAEVRTLQMGKKLKFDLENSIIVIHIFSVDQELQFDIVKIFWPGL